MTDPAAAVGSTSTRRRTSILLTLALALGATLSACTSDAGSSTSGASTAAQLSSQPVHASAGRAQYAHVGGPPVVRPVRVVRTNGNVENPGAVVEGGSGATRLVWRAGSAAPSITLDFGADVGGLPMFATGPSTVHQFTVTYSETLANLGNDGALTVGIFRSGDPRRTVVVPVDGSAAHPPGLLQGGERYERIELTGPGTLVLLGVSIRSAHPGASPNALTGHFLSSDDLLNRIWYAGAYTLNLDELPPGVAVGPGERSDQHLILDGAKRDRAVWSGDQLIAGLTDYYTSDPAYARDSLALLLDHPATSAGEFVVAQGSMTQPGPLPGDCSPNPAVTAPCRSWSASYSMVIMSALDNYYRYTGDLAFVRAHWPAVVRQMAWDAQQVGPDGLMGVSSDNDADWNLEQVSGELTYVNAVYVQALDAAADLAAALGQTGSAAGWSATARHVAAAVNARLWNPGLGVYDPSTTSTGGVVQDANVMAVLSGIAGPGRAGPVLGTLARSLHSPYGPPSVSSPPPPGYTPIVSPFMGSFNVLADFQVRDTAAALSLVAREWGFMIGHDPGGVDWERIELDGVPAGGLNADSSAHAWSTGPTAALSEYVVGVAPTAPGYRRWAIAPQTATLRWAQGSVPTPHGTIAVEWRRSAGSFVLTESTPHGTTGTVSVPLVTPSGTIARDGTVVWRGGRPAGGVAAHTVGQTVVFTATSGSATYASAAS